MPYRERPIEKLYFSIGEVAEMFGVNTSLIRFWEKEFDVIKPTKNRKGNRMFTREDIENFKKIFELVKEQGYTLQGAKDRLKKDGKSKPEPELISDASIVQKLEEIKRKLNELKEKI